MATKKTSGYATEMRRCTGSARFGIEPHEAPVSTFPKQPSRKDGLGTMCGEHWKAYVKGLREARASAPTTATKPATRTTKQTARKPAPKATTKRERRRTPMAHVPDPKVVEAEALIAEVDALPGPEHVQRVGDVDVQAVLETVANGRTAETPLGEAVDGGAERPARRSSTHRGTRGPDARPGPLPEGGLTDESRSYRETEGPPAGPKARGPHP